MHSNRPARACSLPQPGATTASVASEPVGGWHGRESEPVRGPNSGSAIADQPLCALTQLPRLARSELCQRRACHGGMRSQRVTFSAPRANHEIDSPARAPYRLIPRQEQSLRSGARTPVLTPRPLADTMLART